MDFGVLDCFLWSCYLCYSVIRDLACFALMSLFFFKQKTAYVMRISDWSSDVCSSDLSCKSSCFSGDSPAASVHPFGQPPAEPVAQLRRLPHAPAHEIGAQACAQRTAVFEPERARSEEHTSELQSLMRISYAVFCLHK